MSTAAPQIGLVGRDEGATESPIYRIPPHNTEIEAALLGAILTNNRAFEKVQDILTEEHFFEPILGQIYGACGKLINSGQVASPLTLRHYFENDPRLAEVGGAQYLYDLAASVVTVVNAEEYARIIHDLFLRRQLITLGEDLVNESYELEIDELASRQIERAEQRLFDLATTGELDRGPITLTAAAATAARVAEQAYKNKGHVVGISTGFTDLDRRLGGLHPSDLVILAGRPSMGKTALATNLAFNAARAVAEDPNKQGAVVFFSLEMSSEQLATRILSEQSGVPSDAIRRGDVEESQFAKFVDAANNMHRTPLFIDDTPALTVSGMRTRARRLARQHGGLHLIVIDYLQLLMSPAGGRRSENRVQEVSEITRGLKTLAKELEVPVLALSQLSRQVENREDKRPQLADLRESGSIEQDADVVMFIFREEYYLEKGEPIQGVEEKRDRFEERMQHWSERIDQVRNTASVIIAKQRHGPVGTIDLYFDGSLTRFGDLDHHYGADGYS